MYIFHVHKEQFIHDKQIKNTQIITMVYLNLLQINFTKRHNSNMTNIVSVVNFSTLINKLTLEWSHGGLLSSKHIHSS